jgi:hypothetical protein
MKWGIFALFQVFLKEKSFAKSEIADILST